MLAFNLVRCYIRNGLTEEPVEAFEVTLSTRQPVVARAAASDPLQAGYEEDRMVAQLVLVTTASLQQRLLRLALLTLSRTVLTTVERVPVEAMISVGASRDELSDRLAVSKAALAPFRFGVDCR